MLVLKGNLKYKTKPSLCLAVIPLLMESVLTGGLQSKNTNITKALSAIPYTELCVSNLSHGVRCAFDVMSGLQIVEEGLDQRVGHIRKHESN